MPSISFKDSSTGKVISIHVEDVENIYWQRVANKPGLKVVTNKGIFYRFCGFKETVCLLFKLKRYIYILFNCFLLVEKNRVN